jgi:hypothetical protein
MSQAAIDEKEAIKDAYRANKSELSGLESVLASLRQEIETQVALISTPLQYWSMHLSSFSELLSNSK